MSALLDERGGARCGRLVPRRRGVGSCSSGSRRVAGGERYPVHGVKGDRGVPVACHGVAGAVRRAPGTRQVGME
jgi:hypothetical protein